MNITYEHKYSISFQHSTVSTMKHLSGQHNCHN